MRAAAANSSDAEEDVFSDGEIPAAGPPRGQCHREGRATARTGPQRELPSAALVGTGSTIRRRFRFKRPEDAEARGGDSDAWSCDGA